MSQLLLHIPVIAGSLVASGVVIVSGGSIIQSGIVGVVTGATGLVTSALVTQSNVGRQRLVEQDRDRLKREMESQKYLLAFRAELKSLQDLQKSLQRNIFEIEQYKNRLYEDACAKLKNTENRVFDIEPIVKQNEEMCEQESNSLAIVSFLQSLDIQIKAVPKEDAADNIINSLSKFLGENYSCLRQLLAKIKRNMQQGASFSLSIRDYTQEDMSIVCQFCTRLYDIAFLEEYRYSKSPQYLIRVKTTTLPAAQCFFSGKWLERFVLLTMQRCVNLISNEQGESMDFSYLLNPQVMLPSGNAFEFDLICCVNGFFFWIEAKSGDYQQHIGKYSKMSKLFNLDYRHSIMVLPDISEDRCDQLKSLFSMTVCSLSSLETILAEAIRKDHAEQMT